MTNTPRTPQEWARNYLRIRLKAITKLLGLSENLPKVTTFADLKDKTLFIRFPEFKIENCELAVKNTELYRKIGTVRYVHGSNSSYNAVAVTTGSLHKIIDDEPVIVVS